MEVSKENSYFNLGQSGSQEEPSVWVIYIKLKNLKVFKWKQSKISIFLVWLSVL